MSNFPNQPGAYAHAAGGTSQAAASLRGHASMLTIARDELSYGPATCEELHARLERRLAKRVLLTSVRARVCQLHRQGLAFDTRERGIGESGTAKVVRWALVPQELAKVVAERAVQS